MQLLHVFACEPPLNWRWRTSKMGKDLDDAYARLLAEWNVSEQYMKIAEQIGDKAIISSVNELRYGGRKVLEALSTQTSDKSRALAILSDALHDCYRARHDSIDASVSTMNRHVDLMTKRLGYSKLAAALPELGQLVLALSQAQEKIANSRSRRLDREAIYEDIKDIDLPAIRRNYDQLRASEALITQETVRERRSVTIGWAIGILGLSAAIISILVAL